MIYEVPCRNCWNILCYLEYPDNAPRPSDGDSLPPRELIWKGKSQVHPEPQEDMTCEWCGYKKNIIIAKFLKVSKWIPPLL